MESNKEITEFIEVMTADQIEAVSRVVEIERDELAERIKKLDGITTSLGNRKAALHFEAIGYKKGARVKHWGSVWRIIGHQAVGNDLRIVIQRIDLEASTLSVSAKDIGLLPLMEGAQ